MIKNVQNNDPNRSHNREISKIISMLWYKKELVVSCDGVYSDVLSERFVSDVEGFRRDFSGG